MSSYCTIESYSIALILPGRTQCNSMGYLSINVVYLIISDLGANKPTCISQTSNSKWRLWPNRPSVSASSLHHKGIPWDFYGFHLHYNYLKSCETTSKQT